MRAGAPTASALPWALAAALGCTADPPPTGERPAPPRDAPPEAPPKPRTTSTRPIVPPEAFPTDDPADAPTPLLDVQIPVGPASGPLHLVARRYGPLRLQRLTRDQLAVRGDLAVALAGADGQLRRARRDLDHVDLAAVSEIGDLHAFGGRWPDRSFLVGRDETRAGRATVWRRAHDDWHKIDNGTFENADPLQWEYTLSTPWDAAESIALRVLSTVPVAPPVDADPPATPPPPPRFVRAYVELIGPEETHGSPAPSPAPAPLSRNVDTPDAVPNPDTAPVLGDSQPAAPDDDGLLPTAPADPPPDAPAEAAPAPVPTDSPSPPVPTDSPPATRPAPAAPPANVKFPKLPRELVPRELAAAGATAYVMAQDGSILQATPRPKKLVRWQSVPATGLAAPGPSDLVRLHGTDSGRLWLVACIAEKPALKRLDGAAWIDEPAPSPSACPTSLAEAQDGTLWLATAPVDGHTLWQRDAAGTWTAVDLPRIPWPDLSWERWFAYVPPLSDHPIWERDPPPRNSPPLSPELRASEVVAHRGDVWVVASASIGRATVPHVVLSTRRAPYALEFPAIGEEGLDAGDRGDRGFDETCSTPFLRLRDLADAEHGADVLPALHAALGPRPEFADTVLVEALRTDGRRQLGAIWTNADALDEGFGPLGELGGAIAKLRPETEPTMLCLIPRVRYGIEVRAR